MSTVPRAPSGHFNVLYFAAASSFTGKEYEAIPAPLPLGQFFNALEERYSGIKHKILESCLVTVNLDYVDISSSGDGGIVIKEGDEVAIIPPVSSG